VIASLGAVALIGCGGKRQDADEPSGDFAVEVVSATFPKQQKLAQSSNLEITVRNSGSKTIPDIAVSVNGFSFRRDEQGLADPNRPRFALNGVPEQIAGFPEARAASPKGCDTAYVNTWACGPLRPDGERTLRWSVTAVAAGPYRIDYRVAAGLNGKARAVASGGSAAPEGSFSGTVSSKAAHTRVGPDGKTVVNDPR
jgi:hypothetical protein